ncbi:MULTISPECIES: DUF86 domain-containing protein [Bacillus mojavensis subgroup]|jgi:uncharacterized protein YutE (UPF0331/DUF86 family)|uniref:DUF86 domain-containing protein n=1 Tax=Bacillus mojavensis TaxID=72360 RepID=A0AAP3CVR0_BACMO|nr:MULTISPECIES: DUF86 domain-containing protein [Bacillus mojavensis subgroup]MCR6596220.1 DUF86 domain-containing protein [Bacillus halotolerans]MCY8104978.1 DUF86 domain-containing protein [Bacillus mojavensis]MCY8483319.1 DUF86 domain-containing protein [Bacillus mojavensis]MCY8511415.1 DUF86 domain-containing protein [Bacillus mojavensis]MCY9090422.1 DUF86 domain-containing protein [Bacillus mojavensis]
MYFVDRNKIEHTLGFFERQLALFHSQTDWKSEIEGLALERIGHLLIECILDTGNDMIDGFIMRDPGSYDDIMDILVDEKVVTEEEGAQLKQLIAYRKTLVQQYQLADSAELYKLITAHLAVLQAFPKRIRIYLETELGPVSAFK